MKKQNKSTNDDRIYNPAVIEPKWQTVWEKVGLNKTDLKGAKKPFYNLMMYPYPSAEGLHVGNVYAFTGADIYGRFKKMSGWDVFEPIGFDSGGIHSENYAIKVGVHPKIQVPKNVKNFSKQLHQIGCMYDWDHTVDAMDPDYYKWTQWIFIQLFRAGLAYKKKAPVTWCSSCKTTLSDEQTEEKAGVRVCERCKTEVIKKDLKQWFFRITKYAERLLKNTEKLNWTEKVLIAQRNWIGKSEGAEIIFKVDSKRVRPSIGTNPIRIKVFTTRQDTLFGCTFFCLAPEHPLVDKITSKENKKAVSNYVTQALKKSDQERKIDEKDKTGVFTGGYVINPVNNEKLPVWVADYVLIDYGGGAVMGVPGHDKRDWQFAKKYKLPIKSVIKGKNWQVNLKKWDDSYMSKGKIVNSKPWNGWQYPKDLSKVTGWLEQRGFGKKAIEYKIRDWCISRQRYWGPPIPMIFCSKCAEKERVRPPIGTDPNQNPGWFTVPEDQLPVLLPDTDDYLPGEAGGKSPLARVPEFVKTICPKCGGEAQRETDVSDTFLDSSWYFLRYPSVLKRDGGPSIGFVPYQEELPFDPEITKKWLPVTQYIGGAEHSVLHLLYSRFIWMVLYDLGYFDFSAQGGPASGWEEPFPKFYAHGMIIKDGAKMSKSRGNIVNPDEYISKFGTDALRCYLMFLGPFNQGGDFCDTGMIGMYKFLGRVYRLCQERTTQKPPGLPGVATPGVDSGKKEAYWINKTIKKVGEDIAKFKYNTAIAAVMEFVNFLAKNAKSAESAENAPSEKALKTLILILVPFAPHLAEELWQQLQVSQESRVPRASRGEKSSRGTLNSVHSQPWPKYDPELCKEEQIVIVVQVNGKVRDRMTVSSEQGTVKEEIEKLALNSPKIQKHLKAKNIRQTIFIPGKLINFVI